MIVIDSSAVIKIIITEDNSNLARLAFSKITEQGEPMIAPNIIFSEVMNGLWKHNVLLKDINSRKLDLARSSFVSIYNSLEISSQTELAEEAIKLATSHKITFYDSLYVALSIKMRSPLFTFDNPLKGKAKGVGFEVLALSNSIGN
jgi:predicted nucleic acid-binding protein